MSWMVEEDHSDGLDEFTKGPPKEERFQALFKIFKFNFIPEVIWQGILKFWSIDAKRSSGESFLLCYWYREVTICLCSSSS